MNNQTPAIPIENLTARSIPPRPLVAITVPEPVDNSYAPRASAVHASIPRIMTVYKLAAFALMFIPVAIVAAVALVALIGEGRSRHRQHEQQPKYND